MQTTSESRAGPQVGTWAQRRLYRSKSEQMVAGVCGGRLSLLRKAGDESNE